jgi:DNA-binding beta-propeller fold protein YncE
LQLAGKNSIAIGCAATLCIAMAACGGGRGSSITPLPPFLTATSDEFPPGTRTDVSGQNLFPMGAGDHWTYKVVDDGGVQIGTDARDVFNGSASSGHVILSEDELGETDFLRYTVTADGLMLTNILGDQAPSIAAGVVGAILEYPTQLPPPGATRRAIRSGPWGEDLDGDFQGESFRLEFSQVFVGFESVQFSSAFSLTQVAHFRNVITLTLRFTKPSIGDQTLTATEETWFAPGAGMVRAVRSSVASNDSIVDPRHTLELASAQVAGVLWSVSAAPPILDGSTLDVPVPYNALVYDAVRNRYYVTVPASAPANANRIATIEPATGQVTYSPAVGVEPTVMALAADGSALYVGLRGTGDVVKLAPPSMTELGRVRLPTGLGNLGQSFALDIAASPVDANAVAVTLYDGGDEGVALLRDMVVQPKVTDRNTRNDYVVFDSSGTNVYGFGGDGITRIAVLSDGLVQQAIAPGGRGQFSGQAKLGFAGNRVLVGSAIINAPDLTSAGRISDAYDCIPSPSGPQLWCRAPYVYDNGQLRLFVADLDTFVIRASLLFSATTFGSVYNIGVMAAGPPGQVAIGMGNRIRLFTSDKLLSPPPPPSVSWPVTFSSTQDGQAIEVAMPHNSLVYDGVRNLYYASVPGSVIGAGNSIASIDPATGQVTHSRPVGSDPNPMALAADGSFLYVGLDGSAEVVRLALPSMAEQGRARLPTEVRAVGPPAPLSIAKALAVSPADPTVAAASLHAPLAASLGTALLRDMVAQPQFATTLSPWANALAFDPSGAILYGVGTGELSRMQVVADGLADQSSVSGFFTQFTGALGFANGRVLAGNTIFDATTLTSTGSIVGQSECLARNSGPQLVCFQDLQGGGVLQLASADTLALGPSLVQWPSEPGAVTHTVVLGPANQVGVSYPFLPLPSLSPVVRFFSSAQLP